MAEYQSVNDGLFNPLISIQYHLWEHPLYERSTDTEALNVLVFGFGNYGQKFLDACLQDGQNILGKKLCVTVAADSEDEKKKYLAERPELDKFFHIDGSLQENTDAYGTISFVEEKSENLHTLLTQSTPQYIFIALGRDGQNLETAKLCKQNTDTLEMHCVITYVWEGMIEPESTVAGFTTSSCKVRICDRCNYKNEYTEFFANSLYFLLNLDAITVHLNTETHQINVIFDTLIVTGINLTDKNAIALMEFFRQQNYIILPPNRSSGDPITDFTYGSREIKELLTTAGKMLEIYIFHSAKETGRFDDIVSSFAVDWENTGIQNEFDLIATKGFRSLFVECKARSKIEQEFYFKIATLAEQFGIHATAVLIADTQEKQEEASAMINALQRKRGKMLDVITVYKPEEITDIGQTLTDILNGTYESEEQ